VTEAIVATYLEFQTQESETSRTRVLELLDEEVAVFGKKIDKQRETVRALAKETGGGDGPAAVGAGFGGQWAPPSRHTHMAALQQRQIDAEVNRTVAAKRVEAIENEISVEDKLDEDPEAHPLAERLSVKESDLDALIEKEPAIVTKRMELKKLQGKLGVLNPDSVQHANLQKQVLQKTSEIEEKKAAAKPRILEDFARRQKMDRKDSLLAARKSLQESEHSLELLKARIKDEGGEQKVLGDKSLELQFARDELAKSEDIRRHISDRIVHLTTEGRAPAQVIPLKEASLPEFEDGPSIGKKMAMVGVGTFILPSLALVGWSLLRRRVFEREQIEGEFKVKFVSEVATLPSRSVIKRPGSGRSYQRQVHMYQESINSLRATLMTDEQFKKMQVFAVASAVAAEGKTNLSSQLAMSWSQAGLEKILLLDADLRNPNIYKLFEIQSSPGLAEILRGECSIDDATVLNWGGLLSVMPAGSTPASAAANMFSGRKFQEVLAELRKRYDKIIIDMPPTLCASEALLISKAADGILLCARHDYSSSGQIKHAYDRLTAAGVNVIGAVLNGTPVRGYSYSYRGYAPS
jgi:capsular exopolysaccharide synthesis family protein